MDVKAFNESGIGYWAEGIGCLRANETNGMGAHLLVIELAEDGSVQMDDVIILNDQGGQ